MAAIRVIVGFLLAVVITTALGSFAHTQMIANGLAAAGAPLDLAARLEMSVNDLKGLAPTFGVVVGIGLLVGFMIAALLRRILKPLAQIAFPLAGAAAVATALLAMHIAYDGITPIAGARSPLGFSLISLAGAVGGFAFAAIAGVRRR